MGEAALAKLLGDEEEYAQAVRMDQQDAQARTSGAQVARQKKNPVQAANVLVEGNADVVAANKKEKLQPETGGAVTRQESPDKAAADDAQAIRNLEQQIKLYETAQAEAGSAVFADRIAELTNQKNAILTKYSESLKDDSSGASGFSTTAKVAAGTGSQRATTNAASVAYANPTDLDTWLPRIQGMQTAKTASAQAGAAEEDWEGFDEAADSGTTSAEDDWDEDDEPVAAKTPTVLATTPAAQPGDLFETGMDGVAEIDSDGVASVEILPGEEPAGTGEAGVYNLSPKDYTEANNTAAQQYYEEHGHEIELIDEQEKYIEYVRKQRDAAFKTLGEADDAFFGADNLQKQYDFWRQELVDANGKLAEYQGYADEYGRLINGGAWDYLKESLNQVLLGNYTDDVTLLGTAGQVALGLFELDLPADLRDIFYDMTHWETSLSHIGQTAIDLMGLLPVVGILKNADEIAALAKAANKGADVVDEIGDAAKSVERGAEALGNVDELGDAAKGAEKTIAGLPKTTKESVDTKLSTYLLNPEHPSGGSKAKWFEEALGFSKVNSDDLASQILFDLKKAVITVKNDYGTKFSQIIPIQGANGRTIDVEFIWIKNNDGVTRLVTGIPTKK